MSKKETTATEVVEEKEVIPVKASVYYRVVPSRVGSENTVQLETTHMLGDEVVEVTFSDSNYLDIIMYKLRLDIVKRLYE